MTSTTTDLPAAFTFIEYEGDQIFFEPLRLPFADGFTALTGESGVGKSTVVETLAYAVRAGEPPRPRPCASSSSTT